MAAFQQAAKRRRLSLSMMVMLLLHWSFSSCAALADTLCVEPDGVVVWEQSGDPCHSALVEHASDTPCVDFQAQDGHDDHASVYSKLQLTDPPLATQPLMLTDPPLATQPLMLSWLNPTIAFSHVLKPDSTGPPVKAFSIIIRDTAYLHI